MHFLIFSVLLLINSCISSHVDPKLLDIPEIHSLDKLVKENYLLSHDFLRCYESGDFKNMTQATEIFAKNHFTYSKNFINYLRAVLSKINNTDIKKPIEENIQEENGNYEEEDLIIMKNKTGVDPTFFNKIPHKFLARRFIDALNINLDSVHSNSTGHMFTKYMLDMYEDSNACEALAVIGFSIEETVSTLYQYIWNGLRSFTDMADEDFVFFPLHILLDDGHADLLKLGYKYYLQTQPELCKNSQQIVINVLNERTKFFDKVRNEIETKQGYQCKLPYSEFATDSCETADAAVVKAKSDYKNLNHNKYTLLQKMSLSARILAEQNHGFTLSGQISCREPNASSNIKMWVNVYGKPLELVTPNDFVLVNKNLTVLRGNGFPNKATRFHYHIYKNRKDIKCIIHTHPPKTSALSMTGTPLIISHMDTMAFYNDVQYLEQWPGIPFGDEEGDIISAVLNKNYYSALLGHHGLIVGGSHIEQTTYRAFFFEKAASMQLEAMAAVGGDIERIPKVDPVLATKAREWRLSDGPTKAHFNGWAEVVLKLYKNRDLKF